MFVGEAPGASEDEQGLPFVGRAGKLLETLLKEIGLERKDVFIANVLKCRPPGNRDPLPLEIENCREYLYRQVELIQPRVICSLGNFSTKLLGTTRPGSRACTASREELTLGQAHGAALSDLPSRRGACTPRGCSRRCARTFARLPELLAQPEPPQPVEGEPRRSRKRQLRGSNRSWERRIRGSGLGREIPGGAWPGSWRGVPLRG